MKLFEEKPSAENEPLMRMEFALAGEAKQVVPVAIEELAYAHRWDKAGDVLLVYLEAGDAEEVRLQVMRLVAAGYEVKEVAAGLIEPEDWVAQSQASFQPIHAAHFFVHSDSFEGAPPEGAHVIEMNAGAAFGTGEHATTAGCLREIAALQGQVSAPKRVLDMGCGTAILAIAMVQQWGEKVNAIAVDCDVPAVEVSLENCEKNGVSGQVQYGLSDGYASELVTDNGPYDVIAANILARPLIGMAKECAVSLAAGGYVILSGYTEEQVSDVIAAHEAEGLTYLSTKINDGWACSIMQKVA